MRGLSQRFRMLRRRLARFTGRQVSPGGNFAPGAATAGGNFAPGARFAGFSNNVGSGAKFGGGSANFASGVGIGGRAGKAASGTKIAGGNTASGTALTAGKAAAGGKLASGTLGVGAKFLLGVFGALGLVLIGLGIVIGGSGKPVFVKKGGVRMSKLMLSKLVLLLIVSALVIGFGGWMIYRTFKTYNVVIAAGDAHAESYMVMQALKTVTERYYPRIKITVHESSGTTDSLNRLESRQAQMAAAQADVVPGPSARTVAVLFEDAFQLLVHKDVPVTQFVDLKGRRIALARSGGQYRSFQFLAQHYGLKESDMTFVGGDDEGAELAFARNEADAIFRVRPLHDAAIAHTVSGGAANFVPITDISALSADMPAYTASSIPKGAYAANPIIPPADIPTVSVQRLLVARRDVENEVVYAILRILMERHDELAAAIPNDRPEIRSLIAHISRPVAGVGLNAGLHPGATAYYDRESTSFVRSHADLLALLLAGFVFAFMWFSQLGQLTAWRQKRRADQYNRQVLALLRESRLGKRERSMEQIRSDLTTLLLAAVQDLERDRLSEESFHSFHRIWQIAHDMIGLDARTPRPKSDVVTEVPEPSPSSWGLVRFFKREA